MTAVLEAKGLCKRYGRTWALRLEDMNSCM
jgi:hypothetical protein